MKSISEPLPPFERHVQVYSIGLYLMTHQQHLAEMVAIPNLEIVMISNMNLENNSLITQIFLVTYRTITFPWAPS